MSWWIFSGYLPAPKVIEHKIFDYKLRPQVYMKRYLAYLIFPDNCKLFLIKFAEMIQPDLPLHTKKTNALKEADKHQRGVVYLMKFVGGIFAGKPA